MLTEHATHAARAFVRGHARILEQRRADALFDGADPSPVVDAVLAYRNPDGGFGHGLEPDTRCPDSQPLYAQVALEAVGSVGTRLPDTVSTALCDHLGAIAGPDSPAVPIMRESFARHPRATHWQGVDSFPPDLNPTAPIVGMLLRDDVRHPWLDDALDWCLTTIEKEGPGDEAHRLLGVLTLLAHLPDRDLAERLADDAFSALESASYYRSDPDDPSYGLTPIDYAPTPASAWRSRFDTDLVAAHLDALAHQQQPDGGWPIRWEPPTEPSVWEWRGMLTVQALASLDAAPVR